MTASAKMNLAQRHAADFAAWVREMSDNGLSGPSPGGAAAELGCTRPHIDMLVAAGVLERNAYDQGGHKVIMISQRSIEAVKRNKKTTGSWNPRQRKQD